MNPSARRNARQYALQAMYQWQISETTIQELELEFLTHQIKQKTDLDYFKILIQGTLKNRESIDSRMIPFLSRPIDELDLIELAILRLSIYELTERLDVPYRV